MRSVFLGAIAASADTPAARLRHVILALAVWFGDPAVLDVSARNLEAVLVQAGV